ncbi:Putative transposable element [Caligus rogercresseyi]|uniref:Transposable element n=1 Tax=Caligus rogercresseyi TaxID=217165 RepID=A0A7T8HJF2_CALRO|nr:Putative transposable element [Caligus rogercresseyi]
MEAKRHEVAVLIRTGHGTNDIVTLTNVCRRTVCFNKEDYNIRNVTTTDQAPDLRDDMAPIWFDTGYKLTAADYLEILKTKITKKAKKSSYVFQQDGAPAHTANVVQKWMADNMETWPKNIKACKIRHSNVNDLKTSVNKVWRSMRKVYVADVCRAFRAA